jgi:D-beta-D-heptose 7-phosphate kinase / D-beta-D-heptose 1-phosphate adenosyltransferase
VTESNLVVVGDALLDRDVVGEVERLAPDAPVPVVDEREVRARPGGAGLAAALLARDGIRVTLITATGEDAAGSELLRLLAAAGVEVVDLGFAGTTAEKTRIRASGRSLVRVDRGRAGPVGEITSEGRAALDDAEGVLVSDYGRGVTSKPGVRAALASLSPRVPVVWDPHPRGASPVPHARLATPNRSEAASFTAGDSGHVGDPLAVLTRRGRTLLGRWEAAGVAVTLGDRGALFVEGGGAPLLVPAEAAKGGDPCGAGDRFASTAARLLVQGALPSEAVAGAVAEASAFVTAGGAASLNRGAEVPAGEAPASPKGPSSSRPTSPAVLGPAGAASLASSVRASGRTVVATGGCFDLLHAGHIATLQAARSLGDCLIVCLNSDDSVRRLKGPERPLVPQADRAAVLAALECVDAVVAFDEDTPEVILDALRPCIFAKGGDYRVADLPEAAVLARWGGETVVLPYVEGRSTTRLLEEARRGIG